MCPRMVTVGSQSSNSKHPKSCRNEQEMNQVMYIANPNCNLGAEKHGELLDKQNASTSLGVIFRVNLSMQHPGIQAQQHGQVMNRHIYLQGSHWEQRSQRQGALQSKQWPPVSHSLRRKNESGPQLWRNNKYQASVVPSASRRPMRECQDEFPTNGARSKTKKTNCTFS